MPVTLGTGLCQGSNDKVGYMSDDDVKDKTDEELRRNLLTCDYRGVVYKGLCLEELLRRERDKANGKDGV